MSVAYRPVQWNRNKMLYDLVLIVAVILYITLYLNVAPMWDDAAKLVDSRVSRMRAFGTCAFLMLTFILCIGPAARLDKRFLPLLYNRRHFGVLTCAVAATHALYVLNWYFAFSPTPPLVGLLDSNTAYGQAVGFPFEAFGIFAFILLLVLATTSHDFWLSFLTPSVWKGIHMSIYVAYAAVIAHVGFGYLQDADNPMFAAIVVLGAACVVVLHVLAARQERQKELAGAAADNDSGWVAVAPVRDLQDGQGRVVPLANGERVAVFRHENKLSAISNVCAHQNGPLGEGRVVDGCVTCPWHGFQYRMEDGCAPPPFTEKIPTYRLRLDADVVKLNPEALAPGTYVEPVIIPEELR